MLTYVLSRYVPPDGYVLGLTRAELATLEQKYAPSVTCAPVDLSKKVSPNVPDAAEAAARLIVLLCDSPDRDMAKLVAYYKATLAQQGVSVTIASEYSNDRMVADVAGGTRLCLTMWKPSPDCCPDGQSALQAAKAIASLCEVVWVEKRNKVAPM